jgi:hypothetical protein
MKKLVLLTSVLLIVVFSGCSTVPLEPKDVANKFKEFNSPADGYAGLYVFRDSFVGQALKKDVWIDNECLGETAANVFFYKNVKGDVEHKISTESEFSPNAITLKTESGKNYFLRQYIKIGVFVGGANLEVVDEEEAKKAISELDMAVAGSCSK